MSEEQEVVDPGAMFDPESFVVNSALNGRQGAIQKGSAFIRHNYADKIADYVTALRIIVVSPELEKPRTILISTGEGTYPAEKVGETPEGKAILKRAEVGAFLVGPIGKNTTIASFITNLKASGFPLSEMGAVGSVALDGANFTWRAIEKKYGKNKSKTDDVPSQYHGKVEVGEGVAEGVEGATAQAEAAGNPAVPVPVEELKAQVAEAVRQALVSAPGNEIQRGQLSLKVGPAFKDLPANQKAVALSLLLKDEVLGSIPGVAYDKKTVKLTPAEATGAKEASA